MKKLFFIFCVLLLLGCEEKEACSVLSSRSDLVFSNLATSWDEAMPLLIFIFHTHCPSIP